MSDPIASLSSVHPHVASLPRLPQLSRAQLRPSHRFQNLRLLCSPTTPAKDTLDVWPALPLLIHGRVAEPDLGPDNPDSDTDNPDSDMDDIIAALGQSNRVCQVTLWNISHGELEQILAAMQVPFPELIVLQLFAEAVEPKGVPDLQKMTAARFFWKLL